MHGTSELSIRATAAMVAPVTDEITIFVNGTPIGTGTLGTMVSSAHISGTYETLPIDAHCVTDDTAGATLLYRCKVFVEGNEMAELVW